MAANTEAKKTEEAIELPDYFDIGKAAAIAGKDKAESFYNEVMFTAVGNLNGHDQSGVSFKGLIAAANDPKNSSRALAQETLEKVTRIFKEVAKSA